VDFLGDPVGRFSSSDFREIQDTNPTDEVALTNNVELDGIPIDLQDVESVQLHGIAVETVLNDEVPGVHLTTQKARRREATTPDPAICPIVV
jgi:hypothetical protein